MKQRYFPIFQRLKYQWERFTGANTFYGPVLEKTGDDGSYAYEWGKATPENNGSFLVNHFNFASLPGQLFMRRAPDSPDVKMTLSTEEARDDMIRRMKGMRQIGFVRSERQPFAKKPVPVEGMVHLINELIQTLHSWDPKAAFKMTNNGQDVELTFSTSQFSNFVKGTLIGSSLFVKENEEDDLVMVEPAFIRVAPNNLTLFFPIHELTAADCRKFIQALKNLSGQSATPSQGPILP